MTAIIACPACLLSSRQPVASGANEGGVGAHIVTPKHGGARAGSQA